MNRILHILKETDSSTALEIIRQEAKAPDQALSVLFIQEAVRKIPDLNTNVKIYVLKEDLQERGLELSHASVPIPIDYAGMVELIDQADKVVAW